MTEQHDELSPIDAAARWQHDIQRMHARSVLGNGSSVAATCRALLERCRDIDRKHDPDASARANLEAKQALDKLAMECGR